MWGPALSLLLLTGAPCPAPGGAPDPAAVPAPLRAQVAVAAAIRHRSDGALDDARRCLDFALDAEPTSTLALRERAQLRLQAGDADGAWADAQRAASAQDVDPEAFELAALIAAARGDRAEARRLAGRAGTWTGALVAVSLDDTRAAFRLAERLGEATRRGALTALVLAAHEARVGEVPEANALAKRAITTARAADAPRVVNAGRALSKGLAARGVVQTSASLQTSIDHLTNPGYASLEEPGRASSVRLALRGGVRVRVPLGPLRLRTSLEVQQHGLLARRSRFCCLDLFGYRLATALELPVGPDPRAVRLGVAVRWTDVFADRFRFHHASHLEGGPTLKFRLAPRLDLELGFFGVLTDFVDTSPSDARNSSLDRDRVGQRAILALKFGLGWVEGRVEGMFLNDDADGDAFDALGGALAVWLEARPQEDLTLFTGASVTVREYGPVGDRAVIGAAATRTEVRSAVKLGARLRLLWRLELVLEDTFIDTSARAGHDYGQNVLSVGVRTAW